MKVFVTSRRFLIPLLIVWIAQTGYLTWQMWIEYKGDFQGKGLPAWVKTEWFASLAAGSFVLPSFLAAFLVATAWYSHYRAKRDAGCRPFSLISLLVATGIALLGFIYTSYCAPKMIGRNRELLVAVVYAGSSIEFEQAIKVPLLLRNPQVLTLPELLKTKDSLGLERQPAADDFVFGDNDNRKKREINYHIANKIGLPILILLFYVLGTLLGISFRRTYGAFPVLIAYFILFAGWYYGQEYFHRAYRREESGILMGANGMTLILTVIALGWLLIFRKYRMSGKEKNILQKEG